MYRSSRKLYPGHGRRKRLSMPGAGGGVLSQRVLCHSRNWGSRVRPFDTLSRGTIGLTERNSAGVLRISLSATGSSS